MRHTDERQMNERCRETPRKAGRMKGVLLNEQTILNMTWDDFENNRGWMCHRRTATYLNSESLLYSDTDKVIIISSLLIN